MRLRHAEAGDLTAIREVQTAAFGDDGTIADLVDALLTRTASLSPLSIVATLEEAVVGHVLLTSGWLDAPSRLVDVWILSPLAVSPMARRRGVGSALICRALAEAAERQPPLVFLEGDPAFYGKRGFEPACPLGFRKPSLRIPDPAFQVARLPTYGAWMTGSLIYPEPFWRFDSVGLRDDVATPTSVVAR